MIPKFAYPGGKGRIARWICAQLPPSGSRFVDVFAGRGNVTWAAMMLLDYKSFWINDLQTIPFFNQLRISHLYRVPEPGRQAFEKYREYSRGKVLPDGRRFPKGFPPSMLMEAFLAYDGGTFENAGRKGGGVTPMGFAKKMAAARGLLILHEPRITRWDYRKVLRECTAGDVVYIDAPYLNSDVGAYDGLTIDYPGLVQALLVAPYRWVFSEYPNEMYQPLTDKFGPPVEIRKQKAGRAGKKDLKHGGIVTECLWRNFPI
jgi:D12 class N6 adenine-specific DNA methyltransferase